ncbi:MAG: hypothetical protein ACRDND_08635 [Streptosporangiaceae bacterium]
MPRRFERHARSKWDWGTPPARSAERAAAAAGPAGRAPGRKDRWARCKQNQGGPHVLKIMPLGIPSHHPARAGCCWFPAYDRESRSYVLSWSCRHHEACEACGKEARCSIRDDECPDYPGTSGQRAAAEREAAEWAERRARWKPRKPVPDGPQGYRRGRAS